MLFLPTVKWSLLFYFTLVSYPMLTGATFPVDNILDKMKEVVIDPIEDFIQDIIEDQLGDIAGVAKVADVMQIPDMTAKPGCLPWLNCPMKSVPTMRSLTFTDLSGDITSLASDIVVDMTELTKGIGINTGQLNTIITDTTKGIPLLNNKITTINTFIDTLTKTPLELGDVLGNEVDSLAKTLKTCGNRLTSLIDPARAFDKVLKFIDGDLISSLSSVSQVAYKVLAVALLQYKELIEFACNEVLPGAIKIVQDTITGNFRRRRRRMPQSTRYPNTDGAKCDGDAYIINQFFAEQENCESLNYT
eukprot:127376_1